MFNDRKKHRWFFSEEVLEPDEVEKCASEFYCIWDDFEDDGDLIAEAAAEIAWNDHDGWEWMPNNEWIYHIYHPETKQLLGSFTMAVDFEPTFYARKAK